MNGSFFKRISIVCCLLKVFVPFTYSRNILTSSITRNSVCQIMKRIGLTMNIFCLTDNIFGLTKNGTGLFENTFSLSFSFALTGVIDTLSEFLPVLGHLGDLFTLLWLRQLSTFSCWRGSLLSSQYRKSKSLNSFLKSCFVFLGS